MSATEMHDKELCTPNLHKSCGNIIEALQQSSVAAIPNNLLTQLVMERASKVYRILTTKGCSITCSLCPVYMIRPAGIRVTLISHQVTEHVSKGFADLLMQLLALLSQVTPYIVWHDCL